MMRMSQTYTVFARKAGQSVSTIVSPRKNLWIVSLCSCLSFIFPSNYAIRPEFKPQPQDVVITKQRASVFFGTPLIAHLTQLGVQTLIICGESTSGCVRATAV